MDRSTRADRVRPIVQKAVRQTDIRKIAEEVGIPHATLYGFVRGSVPRNDTLSEIESWADRHSGTVGGGQAVEEAPSAADTLDQWGLARARAIEALAELLREDNEILRLRAAAALEVATAARIEAEKAPSLSASGDLQWVEKAVRAAAEVAGRAGVPSGVDPTTAEQSPGSGRG